MRLRGWPLFGALIALSLLGLAVQFWAFFSAEDAFVASPPDIGTVEYYAIWGLLGAALSTSAMVQLCRDGWIRPRESGALYFLGVSLAALMVEINNVETAAGTGGFLSPGVIYAYFFIWGGAVLGLLAFITSVALYHYDRDSWPTVLLIPILLETGGNVAIFLFTYGNASEWAEAQALTSPLFGILV